MAVHSPVPHGKVRGFDGKISEPLDGAAIAHWCPPCLKPETNAAAGATDAATSKRNDSAIGSVVHGNYPPAAGKTKRVHKARGRTQNDNGITMETKAMRTHTHGKHAGTTGPGANQAKSRASEKRKAIQ